MTQQNEALVAKLTDLVQHGSSLKGQVGELFRECAQGQPKLNYQALLMFIRKISSAIGVPPIALGNAHDDFERYDFDGDGGLEEHECYRLVKTHLKAYRKRIGHVHSETNMEVMTTAQAGLTLGKKLGHGAFGTVLLATDRNGETKCVKKLNKAAMPGAGLEELAEEFSMMHDMNNSNIAKTYELFQDSTFIYMVNEPYFGGDLSKIRQKAASQGVPLTDEYWQNMFKQCFQGLSYLHDLGMMHCDIKEENIMIKTNDYRNPQLVIIDFGLAQHDAQEKQQICGTPGYIPPETWQMQKWYPTGDVFSMGVTMLQLVIDQIPEVKEFDPPRPGMQAPPPQVIKLGIFSGNSIDDVQQKTTTLQAPLHRIPPYMNSSFKSFISKCLQKSRAPRPTSLMALSDPWFTGVAHGMNGSTGA